ncbi:hypothetical protein KXV51_002816 [Aspergillus fumigatus]|nr:hypothetical protein KXV51_002816 [Aspergillus fumigatus]
MDNSARTLHSITHSNTQGSNSSIPSSSVTLGYTPAAMAAQPQTIQPSSASQTQFGASGQQQQTQQKHNQTSSSTESANTAPPPPARSSETSADVCRAAGFGERHSIEVSIGAAIAFVCSYGCGALGRWWSKTLGLDVQDRKI